MAIRNLIKTGYIKNIITTNFDPLIDEILKDIPHRTFIDGLKKESFSDDNLSINFVKAHGDLQHGNLVLPQMNYDDYLLKLKRSFIL